MAYVTIEGQRYEKELLDLAEKHTTGKGESKIAVDEAREILKSARDGVSVTETEKATLNYIRNKFEFTEAAASYFDQELSKI
jgi:DNA-directed RNA polymerase subunit F